MKNIPIFILVLLVVSFSTRASDKAEMEEFKSDFAKYTEYTSNEDWPAALPWAEKVYESAKALFGDESKNRALATHNYGFVLIKIREDKKARKVLEEALALYKNIYGKASMELVPLYMDLGSANAFTPIKAREISKANFDRALKIVAAHHGSDSVEWATYAVEAGSSLLHKSKSPSGKKMLDKAYKVFVEKLGEQSKQAGYAAFLIGKYNLALGKNKTAIEYLGKALNTFDVPEQPSSAMELSTHAFLVQAYEKQGLQEEATEHCMAIGRMTPFTTTQNYAPVYKPLAVYPERALTKGDEGWVIISYDVNEYGFTENHKVTENKGNDAFIAASLEAAKKYRYAPAFVDGKPVITSGVRSRSIFEIAE